jgi:hypothetical protein
MSSSHLPLNVSNGAATPSTMIRVDRGRRLSLYWRSKANAPCCEIDQIPPFQFGITRASPILGRAFMR